VAAKSNGRLRRMTKDRWFVKRVIKLKMLNWFSMSRSTVKKYYISKFSN
jgi:hypothetical protein